MHQSPAGYLTLKWARVDPEPARLEDVGDDCDVLEQVVRGVDEEASGPDTKTTQNNTGIRHNVEVQAPISIK